QDNRETSPVWKELNWDNGHHAEFVSPPVISSLLLPDGPSISHHQSLAGTIKSIAKFSQRDAQSWRETYDKFNPIVRDALIPYYYRPPQAHAEFARQLESNPAGKEFQRLCQLSPKQVAAELFESESVKTPVLSQMAVPRGVAADYEGGGAQAGTLIAGYAKPELTWRVSRSCSQVLL